MFQLFQKPQRTYDFKERTDFFKKLFYGQLSDFFPFFENNICISKLILWFFENWPGIQVVCCMLQGWVVIINSNKQTPPPQPGISGRFSGLITMILKQSNTQFYLCDYFWNPILICNYGSQFCFEKKSNNCLENCHFFAKSFMKLHPMSSVLYHPSCSSGSMLEGLVDFVITCTIETLYPKWRLQDFRCKGA